MSELGVSREELRVAAETLADKVDLLLDRLARRTLEAPPAGSSAWRAEWVAGTEVDRARKVLLVRIAIAALAGIDVRVDVLRARAAGLGWSEIGVAAGLSAKESESRWSETTQRLNAGTEATPRRRRTQTRVADDQQIALW